MTQSQPTVFFCKRKDGTFLAASIDSPRFCVAGSTQKEAQEKAQRAVDFYLQNKHKVLDLKAKETRVVTPVFEEKELCAVI